MVKVWSSGRIEDGERTEKLKTKLRLREVDKRAAEQRRRKAKTQSFKNDEKSGEEKH
jgi:hypothetical protein